MNDAEKKAILESTLRREELHWNSLATDVRNSDRVAADIGIDALKTAVLINAGAIVALLSFAGQLWNKDAGRVLAWDMLNAGKPFALGLVCGSSAFAVAYFYQSFVTALYQHALAKVSIGGDGLKPPVKLTRCAGVAAIIMIGLAFGSVGCFIRGSWAVVDAVQATSVTAPAQLEQTKEESTKAQTLKAKGHKAKSAK